MNLDNDSLFRIELKCIIKPLFLFELHRSLVSKRDVPFLWSICYCRRLTKRDNLLFCQNITILFRRLVRLEYFTGTTSQP